MVQQRNEYVSDKLKVPNNANEAKLQKDISALFAQLRPVPQAMAQRDVGGIAKVFSDPYYIFK